MTWKKASSLLDYRALVLPQEECKQAGVQASETSVLWWKKNLYQVPRSKTQEKNLTWASLH